MKETTLVLYILNPPGGFERPFDRAQAPHDVTSLRNNALKDQQWRPTMS
jgi:hypothetical protein